MPSLLGTGPGVHYKSLKTDGVTVIKCLIENDIDSAVQRCGLVIRG